MRDRALHDRIRAKVLHAEKEGISLPLKNSTLMKKKISPAPSRPFNALRNLEFVDMLMAVNKAPKGYKPPHMKKQEFLYQMNVKEILNET